MSKPKSQVKFWLTYIVLIVVIIGLAYAVIQVRENNPKPKGATNIQKSLSDFYRRHRNDLGDARMNDNGEFVVDLDTPAQSVSERLKAIPPKPINPKLNPAGMLQNRRFGKDAHLSKVINDYAKKEGLVVIWDLPQDFVVKSSFQVRDTIAGTLKVLRSSIKHNFMEPINIMQCDQKRTIVVTMQATSSLSSYCKAV